MNFTPPSWIAAKYAIKGVWALAVALLLITSAAIAVVMSVQLHGFRLWPFKVEGALAKIDRLEGELQSIIMAQTDAEQAQRNIVKAKEDAYSEIAEKVNAEFKTSIDQYLGVTERFIRNQRVQCQVPSGTPRRTSPAPQGGNSGVPAPMPTDTFVAVRDNDVRACAVAVTYALKAHEWAVAINQENGTDNDNPQ